MQATHLSPSLRARLIGTFGGSDPSGSGTRDSDADGPAFAQHET